MRAWILRIFLVSIALPALAANRVTVEQLEKVLATTAARSDADVAKQLSVLELLERLTTARLEQLKAGLPGEKSRQALLALADTSAFRDPPATDMPATATPDRVTQRRILSLTVDYLGKTLPMLPNLFAERETVRYESRPTQFQEALSDSNPLRQVAKTRVTVLYRDGKEFIEAGADKDKKVHAPDQGLTTWGEFGPILGTVLIDAARSKLSWAHWELGAGGPQAVFRYSVPQETSHYDVRFCCVSESYGLDVSVLRQRVGYRGEITVDPDSGVILRLTVLADLDPGNPIAQADVAVEYGPVEFGGKTYFCPVRGIALAQAPDRKTLHGAVASKGPAGTLPTSGKARLSSVAQVSRQTLLNDVVFGNYHLFRAEARIVTGNEAESASRKPAPTLVKATPAGNDAAFVAARPADETAVESSNLAAQPAATPAAASEPPDEPAVAAAPEPQSPEITVASASGVPDVPALAQPGTDSPVTLRLSARLVDLPLVAFDKKGRTITNLKQEDLEIYDNGAKVDLRSFIQASGAAPQHAPAAPSASSTEPDASHAFSNRSLGPVKAANFDQQGNTIVLYIDNTISFNDLSIVREQMRTFLNGLHEGERIALYVMLRGSFQILQESTPDHALVAATLAKWTPSAESISIGQEQEARNRQTMDYVSHTEDLLSVNGNQELNTGANSEPLDPSLRALGDNPGRDALSGLVNLAGHLGAIPGHKSLVWIASDNVLADWTNNALNIDKGDRIIQSSVLRAQEAMNDAHVSVYPLDASHIEAGGVDASLGTRNVSINPLLHPRQVAGVSTRSGVAPNRHRI